MVGKLMIRNKETNEEYLTDFYFKKEDVRSFYKVDNGLNIALYGQGNYILESDIDLYESLVNYFNL